MIITRTPLRVSLCGGGTDYPSWYNTNGGRVVGGAVNKYSYISVRPRPPFHSHKTRVVYSRIEEVADNADIEHRAIKAALEKLKIDGGIELSHQGDVPGRSGTGSSSTFLVGVLKALSAMKGLYVSPMELAEWAIDIEQNVLGETVGCQDQVFAAHGGLNVIQFEQDSINVVPMHLTNEHKDELEANLLLFFTGISRTSSDVAASYAGTLADKKQEQFAMMRLTDNCINSIYDRKWEELGKWIDMAWRMKASLSPMVSTEEISAMYSAARIHGAFGGKITGAGGGGCILLVTPPDKQREVIDAMVALGCTHIPFKFDFSGSQVVFHGR